MPLAAIDNFTTLGNAPYDFDRFWAATVDQLDEVRPEPVLRRQDTPRPGLAFDKLEFSSLGGAKIAGYLLAQTAPGPHPLIVHSHGYNSQHDVMLNWAATGCHVLGIDLRGFGRSAPQNLARGGYVLTGIHSPQTSILRGAVADVLQAMRLGPVLLDDRIASTTLYGFSFGGGMAIMAAAVGAAPDFLVSGQPTLGWHKERLRLSSAGSSAEINRYLDENPEERERAMATLAYFDTTHFASRLTVPSLIGIGLDDHVVPSRSVIAIANHVTDSALEVRILPVAHSDDPRESLWSRFDEEWLAISRAGIPQDFGQEARQVQPIER